MKRTLKMVKEELQAAHLQLESVPKWHRQRSLKGMKQFYVRGGGVERWMGCDGESNSSPRVSVRIAVKSVSEITLDLIRAEYAKTHETTIEAALEEARKDAKKEEEKDAIRKVEIEAERKAKAERLAAKATAETVTQRKAAVGSRFAEGFKHEGKALTFFACGHSGAILADHYRQEFISLIQNPAVLGMAMDLCTVQYPDFDEMLLLLNNRAHQLEIPFHSIGGVASALKYLCQDFVKSNS